MIAFLLGGTFARKTPAKIRSGVSDIMMSVILTSKENATRKPPRNWLLKGRTFHTDRSSNDLRVLDGKRHFVTGSFLDPLKVAKMPGFR